MTVCAWPNDASSDALLAIYERVNAEIPVKDLRWSIAHLTGASLSIMRRMKAARRGLDHPSAQEAIKWKMPELSA